MAKTNKSTGSYYCHCDQCKGSKVDKQKYDRHKLRRVKSRSNQRNSGISTQRPITTNHLTAPSEVVASMLPDIPVPVPESQMSFAETTEDEEFYKSTDDQETDTSELNSDCEPDYDDPMVNKVPVVNGCVLATNCTDISGNVKQ